MKRLLANLIVRHRWFHPSEVHSSCTAPPRASGPIFREDPGISVSFPCSALPHPPLSRGLRHTLGLDRLPLPIYPAPSDSTFRSHLKFLPSFLAASWGPNPLQIEGLIQENRFSSAKQRHAAPIEKWRQNWWHLDGSENSPCPFIPWASRS